MISVLLTVLKVLGILILSLLGIVILVLLLVLFVPVRYRMYAERKLESGLPVLAKIKATWLLHLLNVHFSYPEEAYVKVRIGCFTVFRSDRTKEKPHKEEAVSENRASEKTGKTDCETKEETELQTEKGEQIKKEGKKEEPKEEKRKTGEKAKNEEEENPTRENFFRKFLALLRNLRYTITQICDKIKKIVKNVKYYMDVISSAEFQKAFQLCRTETGALLQHICPKKIKGDLLIGTGDPASTGQVLAICGILYPFLGNQIAVTPDFEQQIVEGKLLIKGRITLFRMIRCAWIIYFNKDMRRVIKMLKREAV